MVTAIILRYKRNQTEHDHKRVILQDLFGVDKVITVDNSKENKGTAAGFTEGMQQVKDGFIWLLDEDNIPEPDALEVLKEVWGSLENCKNKDLCLASDRMNNGRGYFYWKTRYHKLIDINSVIGSENSCLGLNVFNYKKTRYNLNRLAEQHVATTHNVRILPVAMYGGMFFHSDLLKTIGDPNEKLFMYCDDFDWSYRITNAGGKIILVKDSIITEPESEGNVYYNTRNHLIFQKQFVTSKFKFRINYYAYQLYLIYKRDFQKLKALKDGWNFR